MTSEQDFDLDKGINELILETMIGKYTSRVNNAKTGATITWKDEAGNTLLSGTDANELYQELPQDVNTVKAIIELTNYINDTITFINTVAGLTEINAGQMTGKYTTTLDNVITGTNVKWEHMPSGSLMVQGEDVNSLYQELPQDLASVRAVLALTGYVNDTIDFLDVAPGETVKSANQKVLPNQYTLDLIITDASGDTILNGETINIKEPDGDIQSKIISGQHTAFDIEGYFDNLQTVKVWLSSNTTYDGLTGTVNQSLKLPLSSVYDLNETKADTLAMIIGDVDNKTAYVSFMKKSERDDPDLQSLEEEGGNSEYNHLNAQGEREQNLILAKTTKQGIPTPNDIKNFYNQAVEMLTSKYVTAQGLELVKVNYDSIPGYLVVAASPGEFYLLVDDTQSTPGNSRLGTSPGTFNRGYIYLRTFDNENINLAVSEIGEGIIPLKDPQGQDNIIYFNLDGNNVAQDVKTLPLRIALMYKGLTLPDPTN